MIVIKNNSLRIGLLLTLFILPVISQAEAWYAMSRHGECISLAKMTGRTDTIKGTSTPGEIEIMLKKAEIDYTLKPMYEEFEGMLKFNVPSEEWSMILVEKKYCREYLKR